MRRVFCALLLMTVSHVAGGEPPRYRVLDGITEGRLTIFPVIADQAMDTGGLLTLAEGIDKGMVVVSETSGMQRPRQGRVWDERLPGPIAPPVSGAQVNQLTIVNHSSRPLLLLAGEIVTGGKQDRIVATDRIVAAHSGPVSLEVFCVEPQRWTDSGKDFAPSGFSMAQPSVRQKALAEHNQEKVWAEVARSRSMFRATLPAPEMRNFDVSSSYAGAMETKALSKRVDALALPMEKSYERAFEKLRAQRASGAVVAVDGAIEWADVFANPQLFAAYWPKLVRSYAAEVLSEAQEKRLQPERAAAQKFLDAREGSYEHSEGEPGLYRSTTITGKDFDLFVLTGLLHPFQGTLHLTKMKRQ